MIPLLIIALAGALLRLYKLGNAPHFADMDWFFNSAHTALTTGKLPLLGITASITWLHQGPLWTYFLLLPEALHFNPVILTVFAGIITIVLVYFSAGMIAAAIMSLLPFSILQSQTAYHTSLIPFFFYLTFLLIRRKRSFLAGLFIGFLYQLHLLTFIYWPLWFYLLYQKKLNFVTCGLGFVTGILPFILAGPIQTAGIFVWVVKQLVTGFSGVSSGISTAYWVVLMPGIILAIGKMLKLVYAYRSRIGQK